MRHVTESAPKSLRVDLLTREYPPEVYGGAGVHLEYLARDLQPLADVRVLQQQDRIIEVIKDGKRTDLVTPIPERKQRTSDQVRFLAACPLTRSMAFTEEQLERLSHV